MLDIRKLDIPFVWKLALAVILLVLTQYIIISFVNADESYVIVNDNVSEEYGIVFTNTTNQSATWIQQGEHVFVGYTYDVSGVIPPYAQIAYWDGYDIYDSAPTYNITLSGRKKEYYDFYIDPEIFLTRLGRWYKYDGVYESNSNNHAFTVELFRKNQTLTLPNGTVVNQSFFLTNESMRQLLNPTPEILPEKYENDYLITTREKFNVTVKNLTAMWLFNGEDNSIIYSKGDSYILFNDTQISKLRPGIYSLLIQTIGNNTQGFDVQFDGSKIRWFNQEEFTITEIDTANMVPEVAIKKLQEVFPKTRDKYEIVKLSVQYPTVIISQMEEAYSTSAKIFYHDSSRRGNVSVMDVRGYVNTLPGVNITVTLDAANTYIRDKKFTTFNATAIGKSDGYWRQWQVYIPFYWDALESGVMHTISAESVLGGGVAYADFEISEGPANSYVPPETIKWIEDRNPWVPKPTPEIVTEIKHVTVKETVTIPVPPSEETILEQQRVAYWEGFWALAKIIGGVIAGIICIGIAVWIVSAMKRAKKEREWLQQQK